MKGGKAKGREKVGLERKGVFRVRSGHRSSGRRRGSLGAASQAGGLVGIQDAVVLNRTGWCVCDGIKFLEGGCHFDGI